MQANAFPAQLDRRQFLGALVGLGACAAFSAAARPVAAANCGALPGYSSWKQAFLKPDGRVVDPEQNEASTSEGQGYGMILALAAGDLMGFDLMWSWTQKNLAVRDDALLAWLWSPGQGVADRNNAADGDLLVAWALARASRVRAELADPARRIAQAIRAKLLRDTLWGTVLLPAVDGFDTPKGQVVNLSYWVFPALHELAHIDPSAQWETLRATGLKLLSIARFGRWGLPPDWLLLVDPLIPDPSRPQRYGFEAVRIPLYLAWAGMASPALLAPFKAYWKNFRCDGYLPAWTNLSDDSVDSFGASAGMRAIRDWIETGRAPNIDPGSLAAAGYYSATLSLLVSAAAREARCRTSAAT